VSASLPRSNCEAPWGALALGHHGKLFQIASTRMPTNWIGRRLALIFRRLALIGAGEFVDLESEGIRLRVAVRGNVSDRKFAFMPQFFDTFERRAIASKLSRGGYFIDVGANAGIYSLDVARIYLEIGGGKVFSFEPNPFILPTIRRNINFNQLQEFIEVIPEALGEAKGQLGFVVDVSNMGQSGADLRQSGLHVEVPCRTLLDFISERALPAADALKIDVEGFEDRVLGEFIRCAPRDVLPKLLVIENSEDYWGIDLFDLFSQRGYQLLERTRMNSVFVLTL